ncbi:MAG: OmpA family protein, partial [Flavobacteriales bacterium]
SKVVYTRANGEFSVLVPKCDEISLSASMEGYTSSASCANEQVFEVGSMEMGDVLQVTASLSRSSNGLVQQHYLKGMTLEMPYGLPVAGVALEVIGNGNTIELESNEWGAFVLALEPNMEYQIIAHLNEEVSDSNTVFIAEEELLSSVNMQLWSSGTSVTANNQLHPEMKVFSGQVIQLYHIYFEKNKVKLEESALADLDILFELLQKHPEMTGEIMAHADARASHEYNLKLSQKRAEAAVAYLVNKGIDPVRLQATGYGETMPKTQCDTAEDCSEEQHARNRRVEFRVIDEPKNIDALSRESDRFSAN